jgi:glutamyl-tRNA synthetase
MKVRFAPSPTGLLHVGNARIALLNWLLAKREGGQFLLRLDDTDRERSEADFARAIEEDLGWLGLAWDEKAVQSARLDRYAAAAERLKAQRRLYPCYETPEELSLKRKVALQAGRPPIYDRAARDLSAAERSAREAEGRKAHWRFELAPGEIAWDDLARGPVAFSGENLSDPVLLREDGRPLYTLSSVVDDLELGITHVVRGEDHVTNTAVQIQLFAALGAAEPPAFAHLPLLVDREGGNLSKRLGALSLRGLRESGLEAMTVNLYLAKLGTGDPLAPETDLAGLAAGLDLARFGRARPRFDPRELDHLNAKVLHQLAFVAVEARLPAGVEPALWDVVQGNLEKLEDIAYWQEVVAGEVAPVVEAPELLAKAAELLPGEPWDEATWGAWTGGITAATGAKGRALFRPLRLALTGLGHGPELKFLLPLIGRRRALQRLTR